LNLFFEVLGKRSDGYHEVETLVAPIDLFDTLYFNEEGDTQVRFSCERVSGPGGGHGSRVADVPEGPENLVVRAVELLRRRAGVCKGAYLRLVKRIPTAAGLGGGSSDAAAALVAANVGWRLGWPRAALSELGAELGSDVPLFLAGGAAVCRGRGERVEPIGRLGALHFVVLCPPAGLSTAAVYRVCRPAQQPRSVEPLVDALGRGDLRKAGSLMFNRLEPAAESLSPWIGRLREAMRDTDCLGYRMSGSGTCYFGLCRHARQARRVARRLQSEGVGIALAVRGSR
jgi:4-diphosphocytidyl-2-C-methyl-D-erythritol kinase